MIKHIVLVRFKPDTALSDIEAIFTKIGNLQSILPTMKSYDYGRYNGSDERYKGFDYAFYMEFDTVEERDAYLIHPEHVKVGTALRAMLDTEGSESFFAFDYDTTRLI